MKILHIGKYYSPFEGGIENFLSSFLRNSASKNLQHIVLAHDHVLCRKSKVERFPEGTIHRSMTLFKCLFAPISPFYYSQLKSLLQTYKPDIIHVHMPNLSAFWLLFLQSHTACPLIIHWHADVIPSIKQPFLSLAYQLYRIPEQILLKRASAIIATSTPYLETSEPLKRWKNKSFIIPLGLNARTAPDANSDIRLWQDDIKFRLLCVGRLTYYKGQRYLIEAVSCIPGVELILVGTGKHHDMYKRQIKELGVEDRVTLSGQASAEQLAYLLQTCDALCLPSIERTEAFGLVLLEAMQYAKPCICTDVTGSGMSWVVQHGETGLVATAKSSKSLQDCIQVLNSDPELARQMGEKGKQRYIQNFNLDQVTSKILSLYNDYLNITNDKPVSSNTSTP
jgi:glycosyltransferase involved in cell wall biosynthesis